MPEATSEIVTNDEKQQTVEGEVSAVEQAVTEVVSVTEEKAVVDKPIDEQAQHTAPTEPNIIKTSPDAPPSQGEDSREDTGVPSDDEPHVVEKVVEKIVPADITESDKDRIFSARLAALSIKGNAARLKRQQENHAAIIGYLKQHGYATNNEIEKLCHVADSTATKYLKALERQGLVMQVGRRGRNLRWRLKEGSN